MTIMEKFIKLIREFKFINFVKVMDLTNCNFGNSNGDRTPSQRNMYTAMGFW